MNDPKPTPVLVAVGVARHPHTGFWQVWVWMEGEQLTPCFASKFEDKAERTSHDLLMVIKRSSQEAVALIHALIRSSPQRIVPFPPDMAAYLQTLARRTRTVEHKKRTQPFTVHGWSV